MPGRLDTSLGEFWVQNPWEIVQHGHNLSSYERKRAYWNVQGSPETGTAPLSSNGQSPFPARRDFLDISYLTGADNDGDGRSVVAGDFRNIGRLDLVVRQVSGGAVLLYENNFPQRHYLKLSLRGTRSNRLGIGARLTAVVKGQPLVRELYPLNSFRSQMPNIVHFGLGDAGKVDRLLIHWPSGIQQELTDLPADRHIVVEEGLEGAVAIETVVAGHTIRP